MVANARYGKLDNAIALLVNEAGNPDFERHYLNVLHRVVSFDLAMIAIYEADRILRPIGDNLPYGVDNRVLATYADCTYRYSPFYQLHRRGLESGVYFMEELARSRLLRKPTRDMDGLELDDREEIGYCTVGWPKRLKELDIAIRLSNTQTAQVALYRIGAANFSGDEVDELFGVRDTLAALYGRFWRERRTAAGRGEDAIAQALQQLADGSLSQRELQVLRLVADGLSSDAISATLRIGRETIRTHKKRAYQKLGISSHVELFVSLLAQARRIDNRA